MRENAPKRRLAAALGLSLLMPVLAAGATAAPASAEGVSTKSTCTAGASGVYGKWGPKYNTCQYTSPAQGWKGKLKITWAAQQGPACVEAREAKAKNPDKWQSLSCGNHGEGTIKWPKNTASKVEVRVKSIGSPVVNVQYSI